MGRVAVEGQHEVIGGLVAPSAANDLGGGGNTRLCDVALDRADEVSGVAAAARESRNRAGSGVSD